MKKTVQFIMASMIALAMFFTTYQVQQPLDKDLKGISFNEQTAEAKGFKPKPKPKPSKPKLPKEGFKSGADGEKYLNDLLNGNGHKTYKTKYGKRVADVYVKKNNWIHESKVGYASKTKFIKKQVKKDAWLKKEKEVKGVKWHFFKSAKTGKIGASKPLLQYLKDNKIPYEIHKK